MFPIFPVQSIDPNIDMMRLHPRMMRQLSDLEIILKVARFAIQNQEVLQKGHSTENAYGAYNSVPIPNGFTRMADFVVQDRQDKLSLLMSRDPNYGLSSLYEWGMGIDNANRNSPVKLFGEVQEGKSVQDYVVPFDTLIEDGSYFQYSTMYTEKEMRMLVLFSYLRHHRFIDGFLVSFKWRDVLGLDDLFRKIASVTGKEYE